MSDDVVAPSLELEQDPRAQRREWRFERAGWILIVLLVAAALAGAFGGGPLSRAHRQSADGRARVDYERILRHGTPTTLRITLAAADAADTVAVVRLDRAFTEALHVERLTPEPVESRAGEGYVDHHFRRAAAGEPLRVSLAATPVTLWRHPASVGTAFGLLDLQLFILP